MHTQRIHRLAGVIAGLVLLLGIGAPAALAKEGVEVTLAAPISPDAKPGDVVAVFFRLAAINDTGTTPLRGSDVFLRLFGTGGASTQAAGAEQRDAGLYKAMVEIPAGGATRAEFGLHGTAKDASGKTVASDIIWPFDGILVAAAIPAPPKVDPATGGTAGGPAAQPAAEPGTAVEPAPAPAPGPAPLDLRIAAAAAAGALALGIAAALARGRRRGHASAA